LKESLNNDDDDNNNNNKYLHENNWTHFNGFH